MATPVTPTGVKPSGQPAKTFADLVDVDVFAADGGLFGDLGGLAAERQAVKDSPESASKSISNYSEYQTVA
jgi:hypothetical protein